jgi:hypothetical protein
MAKQFLTIVMLSAFLLTSCKETSKEEKTTEENFKSKTAKEKNPLLGSWIEPNPINEKEVQGFIINDDGTAASINMATLVYKKWWKESHNLVLVTESIGNGSSSIDTTKYRIIKLNDTELELKNGDYVSKYKKQ